MDRQTYFKKLSRLVAWRPPRTEAEEVLCDDRKIIFQRPAAQDPGIMGELGTGSAVIGLLGLVKARVDDRRWRALYTLALTVSVECVLVTAILHSLNAELSAGWWRTCAIHLCIIGAAGLICTGGCLCPPARAVQGGLHRVVCRKHISRTHQKILSHHRRRKKKAGRAALLLASPVRDHDVPWHPLTAKTGAPRCRSFQWGQRLFFPHVANPYGGGAICRLSGMGHTLSGAKTGSFLLWVV